MFPPRSSHPPCMNMDVNSVGRSAVGLARKRLGTKAHCLINASPPPSSTKKNNTFNAISAYVTIGTVRSALLSSPIGNIACSSSHHGKARHRPPKKSTNRSKAVAVEESPSSTVHASTSFHRKEASVESAPPGGTMRTLLAIGLVCTVVQGRVAAAPQSELPRYSFTVEIEGKSLGTFRQGRGLAVDTEVIEFPDGGGGTTVVCPGNTKYWTVKLTRAFNGDSALWDWYTTSAQAGHVERVDGTITVFDRSGQPVAHYNFTNAW